MYLVYAVTKKFPKEELYGIISQLRRSSLSIMLNYIEGYARCRDKVHRNFLEISYGSLKESEYLLKFSVREKFLTSDEYEKLVKLADEIGAMIWMTIKNLENK